MQYPCARLTDIGSGHDCFPPSPVVQGSPNVIVNNLLCARVTDAVQTHCCLHKDTKILTNFGYITVEDLFKKFQNKIEIFTKSKYKNFKINSKIFDCFISKITSEFIEIILENDEKILVTPEHKFLLSDGVTYCEAQNLKKSDLNFKSLNRIFLEPQEVYDITVQHLYNIQNFEIINNVILKNCGTCHGRSITKGSRTVIVNNLPCARLTSKIDCGGLIVTASPNVIIGGPWN